MENIQTLTDRELEIMLIIWDKLGSESAISTGEILTNLKLKHCKRYLQPLQFVLRRLVGKGFLICEKIRNVNFYTPLCSKKEYFDFSMQAYLESNYPNETKVEKILDMLSSIGLNHDEYLELTEKLKGI